MTAWDKQAAKELHAAVFRGDGARPSSRWFAVACL